MAKKKKWDNNPNNYHCRDCKHSYDPHEKNWKGEFFMCRCKHEKFSKFLDSDYCNKFELKHG